MASDLKKPTGTNFVHRTLFIVGCLYNAAKDSNIRLFKYLKYSKYLKFLKYLSQPPSSKFGGQTFKKMSSRF